MDVDADDGAGGGSVDGSGDGSDDGAGGGSDEGSGGGSNKGSGGGSNEGSGGGSDKGSSPSLGLDSTSIMMRLVQHLVGLSDYKDYVEKDSCREGWYGYVSNLDARKQAAKYFDKLWSLTLGLPEAAGTATASSDPTSTQDFFMDVINPYNGMVI
ncbi:hypothetical protein B0I37DRAFT_358224 [Chaetomium sp. MPI-CAGE-AT-0009]|nr:hypothetical protein B0I37DRAFT_358224 [Chaetomium sp. MPI-CAGE-AT-0009]